MRFYVILPLLLYGTLVKGQGFPGLKDVILDSGAYTPTFRYKAVGPSYRSTRDEALSPLLFEGLGIAFSTSSWKQKEAWLWQSAFGSEANFLLSEVGSSTLNELGLYYTYSALKELSPLKKDQWRFWLGPEAGMLLHLRLHSRNVNNIASYDWLTSVGISGMLSNQFELWGRRFALSNQLQLPLFFLYARPPYAWAIPPGIFEEEEGAWKEAFRFSTLHHLVYLKNQLNIDFYLRKRKKGKTIQYRAYRLAYSWRYFQVSTNNKIQSGGHVLSLSRALSN